MLKAAKPEGLRRYEPISTVRTVSELVDLLATTFSGGIMDSLTESERQATAWEHDVKEILSELIKIAIVIKGLEKGGFRDRLLINTAGTTEWAKFVKRSKTLDEHEKHRACADGFVGDGHSRSKVPRQLLRCGID